MLLRYPVDGPITVYYNPRRPADSLLKPGVSAATWVITILVLALLGVIATLGLH